MSLYPASHHFVKTHVRVITSDLYSQAELGAIPMAAALASLGCGNPTALAELKLGERLLDLGKRGKLSPLIT